MNQNLKQPYQPHPDEFGVEFAKYMRRFPFQITVRIGKVYTPEFKEFHKWCEDNLGKKHLDWFIHARDRNRYTLFLRDSKWNMFLALKFSDIVDSVDIINS